jgi:hypothetical protein
MKRQVYLCVILIALLAQSIQTKAQIQQGNILVGADIADLNLGLDEGGNFSFTINPKAAFFFKDNIALGGYLTFGLSTAKDAGTSINYGVGALGRYYFSRDQVNILRQARFFGEGTVGIDGDNPAVGDNTNGLGISFGPGIAYFITPNIGLEGLFKYNGIIGFGSSTTSNNLTLNVGFQIYLPSSKPKEVKEEIKQE